MNTDPNITQNGTSFPIWTSNNERRNERRALSVPMGCVWCVTLMLCRSLLTFDRIWNILCSCLGYWSQMTFYVLFMRFVVGTHAYYAMDIVHPFHSSGLIFRILYDENVRCPSNNRRCGCEWQWMEHKMRYNIHFQCGGFVFLPFFIIDSIHTNWLKYEHPSDPFGSFDLVRGKN